MTPDQTHPYPRPVWALLSCRVDGEAEETVTRWRFDPDHPDAVCVQVGDETWAFDHGLLLAGMSRTARRHGDAAWPSWGPRGRVLCAVCRTDRGPRRLDVDHDAVGDFLARTEIAALTVAAPSAPGLVVDLREAAATVGEDTDARTA